MSVSASVYSINVYMSRASGGWQCGWMEGKCAKVKVLVGINAKEQNLYRYINSAFNFCCLVRYIQNVDIKKHDRHEQRRIERALGPNKYTCAIANSITTRAYGLCTDNNRHGLWAKKTCFLTLHSLKSNLMPWLWSPPPW